MKSFEWHYAASSCVRCFTYDYRLKRLYVKFISNPHRIYVYEGVGRARFNGLVRAESKGKYFNAAFMGRTGRAL